MHISAASTKRTAWETEGHPHDRGVGKELNRYGFHHTKGVRRSDCFEQKTALGETTPLTPQGDRETSDLAEIIGERPPSTQQGGRRQICLTSAKCISGS